MLEKVFGEALQAALLESRGFTWFFHGSEVLCCFALALFNDSLLLGLLGVWPLFQLINYERTRSESEASQGAPTDAEAPAYGRCPHCGFEQWVGHAVCQRCGQGVKQPPRDRRKSVGAVDADAQTYARCPHCGFEQWKGYDSCEQCGRTMKPGPGTRQ